MQQKGQVMIHLKVRTSLLSKLLSLVAFTFSLLWTIFAIAKDVTICVYDPSGANGDLFQMMKEYKGQR